MVVVGWYLVVVVRIPPPGRLQPAAISAPVAPTASIVPSARDRRVSPLMDMPSSLARGRARAGLDPLGERPSTLRRKVSPRPPVGPQTMGPRDPRARPLRPTELRHGT